MYFLKKCFNIKKFHLLAYIKQNSYFRMIDVDALEAAKTNPHIFAFLIIFYNVSKTTEAICTGRVGTGMHSFKLAIILCHPKCELTAEMSLGSSCDEWGI